MGYAIDKAKVEYAKRLDKANEKTERLEKEVKQALEVEYDRGYDNGCDYSKEEIEKLKIILKEMYDTCIGYNEMKSIVTPDNKYLFSSFSISVELYKKIENIINDIKRV